MSHHEIILYLTPEQVQSVTTAIDYYMLWLDAHPEQMQLREDIPHLKEVQAQIEQNKVQLPVVAKNGSWTAAASESSMS